MIEGRESITKETVLQVGKQMLTAAITAPKAHGQDHVEAFLLTGDDKATLADHMRDIYEETGADFFKRDAGNVDASECVLILAASPEPTMLDNCRFCGFENCAEMVRAGANCALNVTDLGIAVGSAVSIAADNRIDTRVMFSAGQAAMRMDFLNKKDKVCYGIPLSATTKSIYYDRDKGAVLVK